jgi:hypothetical protein
MTQTTTRTTTPIEDYADADLGTVSSVFKKVEDFVTILTVRLEHTTPIEELDLLKEDTVHFVDGVGRLTVLHAHYYLRGEDGELLDLIR